MNIDEEITDLNEDFPDYDEDGTELKEPILNCIKLKASDISQLSFINRIIFVIFALLWAIIVFYNKFHKSPAAFILLIPLFIFLIGFLNSNETIDDKIEADVFSTTFVTLGILFSMPLLTLFNREKTNLELNHIIFLAMISTLLSYLHWWVDEKWRHLCKTIRSCLETFSVTLYIFAITIFFMQS